MKSQCLLCTARRWKNKKSPTKMKQLDFVTSNVKKKSKVRSTKRNDPLTLDDPITVGKSFFDSLFVRFELKLFRFPRNRFSHSSIVKRPKNLRAVLFMQEQTIVAGESHKAFA